MRDGEVMLLTSKAFETLLVLVTHRERAVTKDELMQAVWPNTFVSDDSLTQAISSVRRALGDAECIATIPRRGYKFIVPVIETPPPSSGLKSASSEHGPMPANGLSPLAVVEPHTIDQTTDPATKRAFPGMEVVAASQNESLAMAPSRGKWVSAGFLLAGLAAGALIGGELLNRSQTSSAAPLRFTQEAPAGTRIVSGGVLSPDGGHIAFVAEDVQSRSAKLWVRALSSTAMQALPGTDDASRPFWAPDSQSIGFAANGKLKTVSLSGGTPRTLAALRNYSLGATWCPNAILFSNWRVGLDSVPPWGGAVSAMTMLDSSGAETAHEWPHFLPDGRHYLYSIASSTPERAGIYIGTIGSKERTRLLDGSNQAAIYAPPGYLAYIRDGALLAQRFIVDEMRLEGAPVMIAANVSVPSIRNGATLSAAVGNLLAFGGATRARLVWFNRNGERISTIDTPGELHHPVLSADGKLLSAASFDAEQSGIWLFDLERGSQNRLARDGTVPTLSPDATSVVFTANRGAGVNDVYLRRLAGKNEDEPMLQTGESKFVNDWTSDGRYLIFGSSNAKTGEDLWILPTFGDRQPTPYLRTEFNEIQSRVSPDGRWVAYASNESGAWEVYVQSFPVPGSKQTISVRGGGEPLWRRDGRELYYLAADRTLMAVDVATVGSALRVGRPRALFRASVSGAINTYRSHFAVTADGQRFVIDSLDSENTQESITVISNWTSLVGQ